MRNFYVLGFLFVYDYVLLIEKKRPVWQAGKYNGVGGKVEPGETAAQAMIREFKEEVGIDVSHYGPEWQHCITFSGDDSKYVETALPFDVCVFACRIDDEVNYVNMTDEHALLIPLDCLRDTNTLPNVQWLVPMCLSVLENESRASYYNITEGYVL